MAGEQDAERKRLDSMGTLAAYMYQDEAMKPIMDEYIETKWPGTHGKLAVAQATAHATKALDAKIAEFRTEVASEEIRRTREREIERIKANPELRIRDDEIEALEKFAKERGIGNWEDAAYRYRQIHQVAAPAPSPRQGFDLNDIENEGSKWLKPAFGQNGVNLAALDRVTKNQMKTILDDYAKDPLAADRRWGG